jgi:rubrerythrin
VIRSSGGWTRRDAFRRGAILAGAAGAMLSRLPPVALAGRPPVPHDEAGVLERALEIERELVATYEEAATGDVLDEEVRVAVRLFAEQEGEHVEALTAALTDLGATPPSTPRRRAKGVDGIEGLDTQARLLEHAVRLEGEAIAIYNAAATRLATPDLLRTAAQISCNEAQHLVVLREQLGEQAVPGAFETGVTRGDRSDPSGA